MDTLAAHPAASAVSAYRPLPSVPAFARATRSRSSATGPSASRPFSRRLGSAPAGSSLSAATGRQDLAKNFGSSDIVAERGDDATAAVLELTDGVGVDAAMECVGTGQSVATAFKIARPGSTVGIVGVPHDSGVPFATTFFRNVGWRGVSPQPASTFPNSSKRSSLATSTLAVSSTLKPISTASVAHTRRGTTGGRSSRSLTVPRTVHPRADERGTSQVRRHPRRQSQPR